MNLVWHCYYRGKDGAFQDIKLTERLDLTNSFFPSSTAPFSTCALISQTLPAYPAYLPCPSFWNLHSGPIKQTPFLFTSFIPSTPCPSVHFRLNPFWKLLSWIWWLDTTGKHLTTAQSWDHVNCNHHRIIALSLFFLFLHHSAFLGLSPLFYLRLSSSSPSSEPVPTVSGFSVFSHLFFQVIKSVMKDASGQYFQTFGTQLFFCTLRD